MGAKFLNVDLEVRSRTTLEPLRDQIDETIDLLFCGETEPGSFLLAIEIASSGLPNDDPNILVNMLCSFIERLQAMAKQLWDGADDRVFDIGFETAANSHSSQLSLTPETLLRVGRLGARLAISIHTNNQLTS
jgi:hypothetical protein